MSKIELAKRLQVLSFLAGRLEVAEQTVIMLARMNVAAMSGKPWPIEDSKRLGRFLDTMTGMHNCESCQGTGKSNVSDGAENLYPCAACLGVGLRNPI